ncbi:hypothetical protein HO173_002896 [Letharia columbiana]|uniref:Uncharacterized protein n=1 Tax=Letharia columbiana TaxID=112416 RepID=A0A8H6L844_9LECA|nr:uncharacterized protein HO173_002896 [Letharia columbiana]KAF6239024.1 hypothetical protein HO173_002896 [Letharia columbiana]
MTLSSLLALPSTTTTTTTPGRARPSRSKPDIFTAHNKGAKKRALADISGPQSHARTSDAVDAATLHRSKRKMEDKARLYASMKRGDYVPPADGGTNKEENALVDFDRKWAEADEAGEAGRYETESDDGGDSVDDGGGGGGRRWNTKTNSAVSGTAREPRRRGSSAAATPPRTRRKSWAACGRGRRGRRA